MTCSLRGGALSALMVMGFVAVHSSRILFFVLWCDVPGFRCVMIRFSVVMSWW
jgi:hypothetical protein